MSSNNGRTVSPLSQEEQRGAVRVVEPEPEKKPKKRRLSKKNTTPIGPNEQIQEFLWPFLSCCCCVDSIYTEFPTLIGTASELTCCCVLLEVVTCKPAKDPTARDPPLFCTCLKGEASIIEFGVCLKSRLQCCCIDCRISLPPDDSVPCSAGICGIVCCYKYGFMLECCRNWKELEKIAKESAATTAANRGGGQVK